ncbi:MAG: hypothetical protein LQ352_000527 [Teloschistes flavicans]|nr:MAG: hypothetical protein LQ352_000527 [Teloschistes flavicans]
MGPKTPRDLTESSGNARPAGKGKGQATISRTPSNASLGDLTPEAVDSGIAAVRQIVKILRFAQSYHEEISDVEGIYGLYIRQQARIDELDTTLANLAFRKTQEMAKLQDENDTYQAKACQFTREREDLKRQRAGLDDARNIMQSKMEKTKEMEINKVKQEISDQSDIRVKQIREELEKKIKALEAQNDGLKITIGKLEEKNIQTKKDLKKQKEDSGLEKRSFQSHLMHLESDLLQINAASRLDSDAVRERLSKASAIFGYPLLSTESAVATFLRACAIQDFLSTKTIFIIRRRYFAEPTAAAEGKSEMKPIDTILDTISNIPAATLSQELSWRLTTVEKLDRLGSCNPTVPTEISTEPRRDDVVNDILGLLNYFQSPTDQRLRAKLTTITDMAIKLWSALRRDSCQIDFDYDPSRGGWQECIFDDDVAAANSPSEIPVAQLPSKSFVLFPRITGFFEPDFAKPHILHAGSALPHDSPAFREGLQEIKIVEQATNQFKRSLRRGSSSQSSPITGKRQGDLHAACRSYN